jgi:hypothetical protein
MPGQLVKDLARSPDPKLYRFLGDDQRMRDPNTVAAIVGVLRQVRGDDLARVTLNEGVSLAVLIDTLLRSPLKTAMRSN